MSKYEKIKIFFMGVFAAFLTIILIAASSSSGMGRYQVAISGAQVVVIDTNTSEARKASFHSIAEAEGFVQWTTSQRICKRFFK